MLSRESMEDASTASNHDQQEKASHHPLARVKPNEQISTNESPSEVSSSTLLPEEHPLHFSPFRKWVVVAVISSAACCVTCASSMATFTEAGIVRDFHVSRTVAVLPLSLYVEGLGLGPLLVGPLSEVYGRNIVYRISYGLFFLFSFPVAFAPNIEVFLIFRFLTGFCGSAFLTVAGGSVSDLFTNAEVATPMAFYTICPFIGPVLGPLVSGFINQHLHWRWTYRVLIIWIFVIWAALCLLVPETYLPVLLRWKGERLRKSRNLAPLKNPDQNLGAAILVSCYRPFQLLLFDPMASLLDLWTALILGILYLAFQVFPIIFIGIHHFSIQLTGLTFLGIGVGMIMALCNQPLWNRYYARKSMEFNGRIPPEEQLVPGQYGGILVPLGLFWLAFTTYPGVHWIVPVIASIPFGAGIYLVFTSVFTYLVVAYRPIAASAMASNSAVRSVFAAVFPLFSDAMYRRLGTVGATALLAGLTTLMAPLPFIFYRLGPRLRAKSRFASRDGI